MVFNETDDDDKPPPESGPDSNGKPSLKLVK
jgi:hypothetical protein